MAKHWRETMFFDIKPTKEQEAVLDAIFDPAIQIVFINAVSGSGKTTLATCSAKIMEMPLHYWFSPVNEDQQGFLPGDLDEKNAPYTQPLRKALKKIGENPDKAIYNKSVFSATTWVYPESHTYLRGDDIENCFVVIDEAQNWTASQLKKALTRLHDSCKVFVIGHTEQIDLEDPALSGFADYIEWFKDDTYADVLPLTHNFRGRLSKKADKMPIRKRNTAQSGQNVTST